jgi:mannose-6-phosphate isomerase-like protein (cupin superfamily)
MFNEIDHLEDPVVPVIHAHAAPVHELPGARFTSLATPTTADATDTAVWLVEIAPGTPASPHTLTREEVFVVLDGRAAVRLGGMEAEAGPSDAVLVPAGVAFEIAPAGPDPVRMVCCLPVGGRARLADGTVLTPPWSE